MRMPGWMAAALAIEAAPTTAPTSTLTSEPVTPPTGAPGPSAAPALLPGPDDMTRALTDARLTADQARAAAAQAQSDARQWQAHAGIAARAAEQADGAIHALRGECDRRGRLLDDLSAELARFHRDYGRASDTIGRLRGDLARAREETREAQQPGKIIHKPWPYCGGDEDPLCACANGPGDPEAEALAEELTGRLSRVRDTLTQQAADWELTARTLFEAVTDSGGRAELDNSAGAAGSAFSACAARLRGIVAGFPDSPAPSGVIAIAAPDPDGAVPAEIVDTGAST
jgi:hypothetical protein